jgi:hypothetical protein
LAASWAMSNGRRRILWSVRAACVTFVVGLLGMWQLVHSRWSAGCATEDNFV